MTRRKLYLSDIVLVPLKVVVLASLPLIAGVEIGNRATARSRQPEDNAPASANRSNTGRPETVAEQGSLVGIQSSESRSAIAGELPRINVVEEQMSAMARASNPLAAQAAADAQTNFDCWVTHAKEGQSGNNASQTCHDNFEAALAKFDAAVGGEGVTASIGLGQR